jgi:hypothetical protein
MEVAVAVATKSSKTTLVAAAAEAGFHHITLAPHQKMPCVDHEGVTHIGPRDEFDRLMR